MQENKSNEMAGWHSNFTDIIPGVTAATEYQISKKKYFLFQLVYKER